MRFGLLLLVTARIFAQPPDVAYQALQARQYDQAISLFLKAIEAEPGKASLHKDVAYAYLKTGEPEAAREQFHLAMQFDPSDEHTALEYAFLCFETRKEAEARRIFDRLRRSTDSTNRATAETAFQNIDQPLAAGIRRWREALAAADDSHTHYELAQLAERRDELALAAEHYEKAWRLGPPRKQMLIDLGRVWKALGRAEDATAALLAASRGGEARAAESARELLPTRYPYVYEFQNALKLEPGNIDLRREFAYLLLKMQRQEEAEAQFRIIVAAAPSDLLSAAQLGFLRLARKDLAGGRDLLNPVLHGADQELANRVRAVLRMPQVAGTAAPSPKQMAERSIKAGYLKDAVGYLELAHDVDPVDFEVMLQLGRTQNLLHADKQAVRWFDLARKSSDPAISAEAERSWRNLRPESRSFRVSAWAMPSYSSRWHDTFSYGQVKAQWNLHALVRPYISARVIADTRSHADPVNPMYFSESAVIAGVGLATRSWHGALLWGEAGSSIGYLSHHATPDYRGGVSFARSRGRTWYLETTADALFLSRFQNDGLLYAMNRAGWSQRAGAWTFQFGWNANATIDAKRQYWANFVETGPGVQIRSTLPQFPVISIGFLRGAYTINEGNPRRPNFYDLRVGLWYALSH